MMRILFCSFCFLLAAPLWAREDIPDKVRQQVEEEVNTILNTYKRALNALTDTSLAEQARNQSSNKLREYFSANDVYVWNDIDSTDTASFMPMYRYMKLFPEKFPEGTEVLLNFNNLKISKVRGNNSRNTYDVRALIRKMVRYKEIKVQQDTLLLDTLRSDSLQLEAARDTNTASLDSLWITLDSSGIVRTFRDTIQHRRMHKLMFYVQFDWHKPRAPRAFEVYAVSKPNQKPRFLPLDSNTSWWVGLNATWKQLFSEHLDLPKFPSKNLIDRVFYIRKLHCKDTTLQNLEPLSRLKRLEVLKIPHTQVRDLSPIADLELFELNVSYTDVEDMLPVRDMQSLEILNCRKLDLDTLHFARKLYNLMEFDCAENEITSLKPIDSLLNIEELDISLNHEIHSLAPLQHFTRLTEFRARKMKIDSLHYLSNCPDLVVLDCFNTDVTSLTPIARLQKVIYLDIGHTKITSLRPIRNWRYVKELYLQGTKITDISVLSDFRHLQKLNISHTDVSSISAVKGLPYIQELRCHHTELSEGEVQRFKKKHPKCAITYY